MRINKECLYCKKAFQILYKYRFQKFCSWKCGMDYQREYHPRIKRIKLICQTCKKEFGVFPFLKNKRKFCSVKCSNQKYSQNRENSYIPQKSNKKYCKKAIHISKRYSVMKQRAEKSNLPIASKEAILNWYEYSIKKCVYCDMPEEIWETFYRGYHNKFSLTIDRKDNLGGYTIDNIVFACGMCNVIKTNVLSCEEMKEIGQKYIKPRWQQKILEVKQNVSVDLDL